MDLLNIVERQSAIVRPSTAQHMIYCCSSGFKFFSTYGLFVYLYTVHHTRDTIVSEYILQSFVARLKHELHYAFETHCALSRTAQCLLNGNALPTEPFDWQFLQCVPYLKNEISLHFRFISFTCVGIRR